MPHTQYTVQYRGMSRIKPDLNMTLSQNVYAKGALIWKKILDYTYRQSGSISADLIYLHKILFASGAAFWKATPARQGSLILSSTESQPTTLTKPTIHRITLIATPLLTHLWENAQAHPSDQSVMILPREQAHLQNQRMGHLSWASGV